ncbi:MAG TPA: hypothetical protein DEF18_12025 [Muricauda sp.]|nr:hypothetical protein [Allomuricauda sp.]
MNTKFIKILIINKIYDFLNLLVPLSTTLLIRGSLVRAQEGEHLKQKPPKFGGFFSFTEGLVKSLKFFLLQLTQLF